MEDLKPNCAHKSVVEFREEKSGTVFRTWWACEHCRLEFAPVTRAPQPAVDVEATLSDLNNWIETNKGYVARPFMRDAVEYFAARNMIPAQGEPAKVGGPLTGEMLYRALHGDKGAVWTANEYADDWNKAAQKINDHLYSSNIIPTAQPVRGDEVNALGFKIPKHIDDLRPPASQSPAPDLEKIAEKIEGLKRGAFDGDVLIGEDYDQGWDEGIDAALELIKQAGRG